MTKSTADRPETPAEFKRRAEMLGFHREYLALSSFFAQSGDDRKEAFRKARNFFPRSQSPGKRAGSLKKIGEILAARTTNDEVSVPEEEYVPTPDKAAEREEIEYPDIDFEALDSECTIEEDINWAMNNFAVEHAADSPPSSRALFFLRAARNNEKWFGQEYLKLFIKPDEDKSERDFQNRLDDDHRRSMALVESVFAEITDADVLEEMAQEQ